jgi:protein-arginine kinase activator protein McsA
MKTLQMKLARAIKDENFEQAAALRDEIKTLNDSGATAKPAK